MSVMWKLFVHLRVAKIVSPFSRLASSGLAPNKVIVPGKKHFYYTKYMNQITDALEVFLNDYGKEPKF